MSRITVKRMAEIDDYISTLVEDEFWDADVLSETNELLQALKAEREYAAELETKINAKYWEGIKEDNQTLRNRIAELEAENSKYYDFWQKEKIQAGEMSKQIAELEAKLKQSARALHRIFRAGLAVDGVLKDLADELDAIIKPPEQGE